MRGTPIRQMATMFAAVSLVLAAAACGDESTPGATGTTGAGKPAKKVTLTLNWVPYGEHAPFYYGLKKGFFKAEGIDLEIKPGNGSGNTITLVGQQKTDFGWADTPVLLRSITTGVKV